MYRQTREAFYWDVFSRTLNWIMQYQLDPVSGEWHLRIEPGGAASGDKAGHWKTSYHTGRAIVGCLKILSLLEESPESDAH
jgi:mannose/cellobiose epimerase-like protein (N-acyl-D-glucosamine 2-epimerase family)